MRVFRVFAIFCARLFLAALRAKSSVLMTETVIPLGKKRLETNSVALPHSGGAE